MNVGFLPLEYFSRVLIKIFKGSQEIMIEMKISEASV
ncbi:hypothetical protein SAMN03097699_0381 [Flavobacteriaceae bacterium MAR_2010_188]|nr:hypothetical protein SAMN03097699_0381 [Flavobacteriaceae bacterium MAR_2010_188]